MRKHQESSLMRSRMTQPSNRFKSQSFMRSLDNLERSTFVSINHGTSTSMIDVEPRIESVMEDTSFGANDMLIHKWANQEKVTHQKLFS